MESRARRRGGWPKAGWLPPVWPLRMLFGLLASLMLAAGTGMAVAAGAVDPSVSSTSPVPAASSSSVTSVSSSSSSASLADEAQRALAALLEAGIIAAPDGESESLSREEAALWLYRLLTYLERESFLVPDASGELVLSPSAQAALRQWVTEELAAQLAAGDVPTRERVIERQVVVEAGPKAVLPALTQAEEALRKAEQALEAAVAAQQEAVRAQEATGETARRLLAVGEELLAAQQALGALEAQMRNLSQLGTTVADLADRIAMLNQDLSELQAALAAADQRVTAVDLRVAATQGDIETLRLLIDKRAEELAKSWGIDKEKFEAELAKARIRLDTVEKDAVRQEALAAVTALVESRTGQLESAINKLAGELRPELGRLDQRLTAVETRLGQLDQRVSVLEATVENQGVRLQRMEERPQGLKHEVWAGWVTSDSEDINSGEGFARYGLRISWDLRDRPGVTANLTGSWQSEWEPASGFLWQRLQLAKPVGTGLTGELSLELLPVVADEGLPSGDNGNLAPTEAHWSVGLRKVTRSLPDLEMTWGGSSVARGNWWRVLVSAPVMEADGTIQVGVSGWLAGGLAGIGGTGYPYLQSLDHAYPAGGYEIGYRLIAEATPWKGSAIQGGWEWRQQAGSPRGETARQGWLSLQLPVASDVYLSLSGRRGWFSGQSGQSRRLTEMTASLRLTL